MVLNEKVFCIVLMLTLTSCVSNTPPRLGIQIDPDIQVLTRSDFEKNNKKIELPENYNQENYNKLGIKFSSIQTPITSTFKFQEFTISTLFLI